MRILYSRSFAHDLDDLTDWISLDSPARAISFAEEIARVCSVIIAGHPRAGRLRPEYGPHMRSFATRGRTIFYSLDPEAEILRFHRLIGPQDVTPL